MKRILQPKAAIPYVVLAALLLGFIIPAMLPPHSAFAQSGGVICAPGDQECEAQEKETQAAMGGTVTTRGAAVLDADALGCKWYSIRPSCILVNFLNVTTDWIVGWLVDLAGKIFDQFVQFARSDLRDTAFVKVGFNITLGVANLFFVLILLWIAIATIFDFTPYTARQLLPKLIIAALLINFSLAIGSAFIRLSNGIAEIFYQRLTTAPTASGCTVTASSHGSIYQRVALASCFAPLKNTLVTTPLSTVTKTTATAQTVTSDKIAASLWKLVVSPILIFILFAGSIFLLIRQLSLAFILVLGPLAFLFMILPATQRFYGDWWSRLIKWSFFFPAFMFFLFLSLELGSSMIGAVNPNDPVPLSLQYMLVIALMLMSLTAANQMSIYGASTVTGWGKKMAGAAGRWTKGTAKILGGAAVGAALTRTPLGRLAESRYTRWALRPAEAAVAAGRKVKEQREKAALQRRVFAAKVSPEYRQELMRGMASRERADFVRDMKKHEIQQVLGVMSPSQRIALHQEMKQYDLDDKILDATRDLTSAVELETNIERTDARFQEAFNSWLKGATTGDLQKRISAEDIQTNAHLHTAIATPGVGELADLRTIAHTREKAEAMRQHFIDLGNRQSFEQELALGYSETEASERAIGRAIHNLQQTNRALANELTAAPPVQINLARSRPLGRKAGPPVVVVTTPGAPATP